MENRLLYGFIAAFAFMFVPVRSELFEGLAHFIDTLLYFVGLISAIIFGAILIWNAFRNLRSATK
ncbi:hypothetical protein [Tenuibacillus multivorans]|uniref:Uncharacterized protein n=1 Tax=Tenuibacillus multivorans TaxID=237069 RepID=A0A1H0AUJ8_9BACI|nr:hypothetical protein [Tenuibacillus multivorans]GEL77813.1 hypothetical protein TMU01_20480 [Tenuibacillus multivorans]SDN37084.1 hypothetical protein SAMN05216498_2081 [Tenuibacillus multivorans]